MGHHGHGHGHHHGWLPHLGVGRREEGAMVPPKGWMGIRVGGEGEEPQRFVVPVEYLNHPLFVKLLKESEEEFGFEQKGAITIPCHVEYFRRVQDIIDRDFYAAGSAVTGGHGHHHEGHHHHGHHYIAGCFRA